MITMPVDDYLDALAALATKPWGAWQTFVDHNREARAQLERKRAHL
jgi:hypothetical protein